MKDFIAVDFETANPKRVSACAIGYAQVSNGDIVESKGYLINPVGGHAEFQSKIHGIKTADTCNEPDFLELFPKIRNIFTYPLVAHSLFDKQVINALAQHFGLTLDITYNDTSSMARRLIPELKNYKLKTLVKHFDLPRFKHHDATEDAVACARLCLKLQDLEHMEYTDNDCSSKAAFRQLVNGILEDGVVDYKEAYQLLYWLEDHDDIAQEYHELTATVRRFLEDDILDDIEAKTLKMYLQYIYGRCH